MEEVTEVVDSLKVNEDRIVNSIGETLIPNARRNLRDWKEYNNVDEFMIKYYNVSKLEALNNSKELSDLVKNMIDTIRIDKLDKINVIARFNVLHNETLRLADMANIPSITEDEVKEEVKKIIDLYSAVNSKINTIYKAEELQKALDVDTEMPIELKERNEIKNRLKRERLISNAKKQ
ncbi:hypothetical protein SAMN04488111_2739 [Lutibacter flavus]|uniref:Uncharacterized protein n=2 Tax=Lutibacter flavus TaxID=691689 RepID=A0A238YR35_9FLAO|nr:hypothetical protein SAMN04488111_2739 [Lutibacter flavus]